MTMDLQQRASREPCPGNNTTSHTARSPPISACTSPMFTPLRPPTVTSTGVKRSFDVAFLVAPDERRLARSHQEISLPQDLTQRSAFTKVSTNKVIDLSADRLSPYSSSPPRAFVPSPPMKAAFHQNISHHKNSYSSSLTPQSAAAFLIDPVSKEKLLDNYRALQAGTVSYNSNVIMDKEQLFKLRPMMYPEAYISAATYPYAANFSPPNQTSHSNGSSPSPTSVNAVVAARAAAELLRPNSSNVPNPPANSVVAAPFLAAAAAAAISPVSSLLPPSLAALSLPAQNVCAKCNLSFRMTSDLVYHMRSHHKNEATDPLRRRREEKLKCPVCSESFRERHHLTRHMTAHQDKASDDGDVNKTNAHMVTNK